MLIKEIIERIQHLYNNGTIYYETRLSNRRIYSIVMSTRNILIGQLLSKNLKVSQSYYETLPCIEMETVEKNLCPCALPTACTILRSKYKIPEILISSTQYAIQSVQSSDWEVKFDYLNVNATRYLFYNKYTTQKPFYFLFDDYLYLLNVSGIQYVSMTAIFKDTIESFYNFICGDNTGCIKYNSYLDRELAVDGNVIPTIIQMAIQEINVLSAARSTTDRDRRNDQSNEQRDDSTTDQE